MSKKISFPLIRTYPVTLLLNPHILYSRKLKVMSHFIEEFRFSNVTNITYIGININYFKVLKTSSQTPSGPYTTVWEMFIYLSLYMYIILICFVNLNILRGFCPDIKE